VQIPTKTKSQKERVMASESNRIATVHPRPSQPRRKKKKGGRGLVKIFGSQRVPSVQLVQTKGFPCGNRAFRNDQGGEKKCWGHPSLKKRQRKLTVTKNVLGHRKRLPSFDFDLLKGIPWLTHLFYEDSGNRDTL